MIARKNKIVLSDYNYKRDVENRILLADLTKEEVEILKEIINSSIQFSIKSLADILNISIPVVTKALLKISQSKLLTIDKDIVTVDKELRKYFEFQLRKFDVDFKPTVDFIQSILCRISPQVLPNWYQISRTSDSIFSSIVEKYLANPRVYEKYLADFQFENPLLDTLMRDIYSAPDCRIESSVLQKKYKLTRAQFVEYMLYLEFNFIAFISYEDVDDRWLEVVTPFWEWREYLNYFKESEPKSITNTDKIQVLGYKDFQFLSDMRDLLKATVSGESFAVTTKNGRQTMDTKVVLQVLPHLATCEKNNCDVEGYLARILTKIQLLHIGEITNKKLVATTHTPAWLEKSLPEMSMILYRNQLNKLSSTAFNLNLVNEKNIREAEKSLKRVVNLGWVYFDEFMNSVMVSVGTAESVSLKCKGKKWKYVIPVYSEEERALIEAVIFERLFELGMTGVGTHDGRPCFCLTSIGRSALGG